MSLRPLLARRLLAVLVARAVLVVMRLRALAARAALRTRVLVARVALHRLRRLAAPLRAALAASDP
jgi:hypothetical protein